MPEVCYVIASPPYRSLEQFHGPCFVLDAELWAQGTRRVVRTILPKLPRVRHYKPVVYRPGVLAGETRRIVTWPPGRPQDWRIEAVPVARPEPLWHTRVKALRRAGMSVRRIMAELGLVNRQAVDRVLGAGQLSP